jgi:hypothetical protein
MDDIDNDDEEEKARSPSHATQLAMGTACA